MIAGRQITVIGAGIAGLAVAQALAMRGAKVTVLEQAAAIAEIGAGLQVSPNGAVVLQTLGLGAALNAASMRAQAVELRNGASGGLVARLDMARLRPNQAYHFIHRADLIDLLAQGAVQAGVVIKTSHLVDSVDLGGVRPRLTLASGEVIAPDILIGADGITSKTRSALNGMTAPFFTNQVAWRALIPGNPADRAVAEVHMGKGRHLVSYPLRGGTLRNIVAVEERPRWAAEAWSHADDPAHLSAAFAGFGPRVQGWLDQVTTPYLWGLFRHPLAKTWGKAMDHGAVAILGDAAHPSLPFLAQGASMGLEDAWMLADLLARLPTDQALIRYQTTRAPRCARIVAAASANARNYHLSGPSRIIAHTALRIAGKIAPNAALNRFNWLYDHDVTKI